MSRFTCNPVHYGKRLSIIVPYRNRQDHLKAFIPHMKTFFTRDKLDSRIDMKIFVVEQMSNSDFNKGRLSNAGFDLARHEGDYTCFHDVDYLPLWADYSWSPVPSRLIWHGLVLKESYDRFFGGVVLFDNAAFRKVNGFPNSYWGWGPEDLELGYRCEMSGQSFEKRDGTFIALPHPHNGFQKSGEHTPVARKNIKLFKDRKARLQELQKTDGLTSLEYSLADRGPLKIDGKVYEDVVHCRVNWQD